MRFIFPLFASLLAFELSLSSSGAIAQCDGGEVEIEFVIDTDSWGYEIYWELTPVGEPCGGENFIASGGNSDNVGCDGAGNDGNGGTTYGNDAIYTEGPFCVAENQVVDLIHVDSYGDGGNRFDLYMDGILSGIFNGTGSGNVWTFTAGESLLVDHDVPCAAAAIEVDGESVVVTSGGATLQAGEMSPGPAPSGSCNLPGSWCGSDGYASSSIWLSFIPETSDPVTITTCSELSTFDTQLAVYRAADCGDFSTFQLVGSNDDWCEGWRSTMYTSCLEVGATYYIQLDGWAGQTGDADVSVFTSESFDLSADAQVRNVTCPLDKDASPDGFILPYVNEGGSDFGCQWTGPNGFTSSDSWIFDLAPGVYTADITTTCGTELILERTIASPDAWSVGTTVTEASCDEASDGTISIEVEGASEPYAFAWTGPDDFAAEQQNLDSLAPGTYLLNLTDANGCAYSVTAFVGEVEPSDFTIGNDTVICEDEPLLVFGPLGYDYEWQDGSNNQFFYVAPGSFSPGTYSIVLNGTTELGCAFADAIILTVHDCSVGIGEVGLGDAVLYPNPANHDVFFEVDPGEGGWTVRAFDMAGREVASTQWSGVSTSVFEVVNWNSGQYVLQFQDSERVIVRQLVVQHGSR